MTLWPVQSVLFLYFFPMILNLPSFGHKSTGYPSRQWHDKSCRCFPIILQTKHHSYNQTNKETDKQTNKHTHSTKTKAIATELQSNKQTNKHTHSTKNTIVHHSEVNSINTYLIIPKLSKYPPRPWVPNGSLNEIVTFAMLSRFHSGPNIRFPNLKYYKTE